MNARLLAVAGTAAAGLAAGAAVLFPDLMFHAVTDREEPFFIRQYRRRQVREFCNSKEHAGLAEASRSLRDSVTETVTVTASDGTKLVGHWYPCENAERIILAMHGWRSSWDGDFGACVDFLRDNHCSILFAEQRGQGASGGDALSFGILERYDCLTWANYLCSTYGEEMPLYLAGISMGATAVLLAAELPLPSNVRGLIADCGFTSAEAIWKHILEDSMHLPYRSVKKRIDSLCKKRFGYRADEATTVEALKKCSLPVLLIHGEKDDFVPVQMSVEAKDACASDCTLLTVPDARHGESYLKATEAYQAYEKAFWQKYDKK